MDKQGKNDGYEIDPDRYWQDFVKSGMIKDYLRYAMGLKDE